MPRGAEYRIIRWDWELTKMKKNGVFNAGEKGEAVERLIGAEINSELATTSGAQITTRGWISDGEEKSSECDLIFRRDWSGGETGAVVKEGNVVCIIEVKSDLKKTEIQGGSSSINYKVRELKGFTDAPIFVVGIRHDHSPSDLRQVSIADETVGLGALKYKGSAEKMANDGEFSRLISAVESAVKSSEP